MTAFLRLCLPRCENCLVGEERERERERETFLTRSRDRERALCVLLCRVDVAVVGDVCV